MCFAGISFCLQATHNRAGEITYKWISGYTYSITLITYTDDGPNIADRCQDTIYFGDGYSAVVPRMNGPLGPTDCGSATPIGELLQPGFKRNIYTVIHTYNGAGTFTISMFDRNRNGGVQNIPNSINQPFYLETVLQIDQFGGPNNSVVLTVVPLDKACVGQCFYHNPGAYDPDGDSLSYELTTCKGEDPISGQIGVTIPGYSYPNQGVGTFSIDPLTGTMQWCSPVTQGEYNAAFIVKEWRKNSDGEYRMVGYVLRDMQIRVGTCPNNNPPQIASFQDTCIVAGSLITKTFRATDPDVGQTITLTASGGPFAVPSPTATFASAPSSPVSGTFNWQTTCVDIRKAPYQVTIKAIDNGSPVNLVDFKTYNITVVAPPPKNLTATPLGSSIILKWDKNSCPNLNSGNSIMYYNVYRKEDCTPWTHSPCETGVPASSGFTYIGKTNSVSDTTFTDNNNGNGLTHGVNYSYVVVAVYSDGTVTAPGALSYASNQVCAFLKRDVPIVINVDVQATGSTTGQVFVRWIKPLRTPGNLDTSLVPGPYEFRLSYKQGTNGTFTQVYSVTKPNYSSMNQLSDTTFLHTNTDTQSDLVYYKLDFYANNQFVGSTQTASSVFLTVTPADRKMYLSWQHFVPWSNFEYYIYRKAPSQTSFVLLDSTSTMSFVDSNGLANRALYCYKVMSKGQYSDPSIPRPLLNNSQEVCGRPVDKTAPCSPNLTITSDCQTGFVQLKWNNPNHKCADDVVKYFLYHKTTEGADLSLLDSITILSDTIYTFDGLNSIAGCYQVTAIDSSGNESVKGDGKCVDNCPEFDLPNIFTNNSDSVNDFFKAIRVKYIRDIDLKVYDRWGLLVYETTDPYFKWDGKVKQSGQQCSEGTYFYICQVNEIRVAGIRTRSLKGWVQVFNK
ncbi:MAG: T9SS type B sorting domain-containing protein [Bacteroidia bacterium]